MIQRGVTCAHGHDEWLWDKSTPRWRCGACNRERARAYARANRAKERARKRNWWHLRGKWQRKERQFAAILRGLHHD